MTITTQFDAGQEVLILVDSSIRRETITKVIAEKSAVTQGQPLITYYFDNLRNGRNENYRYESEVAATPAELIRKLAPKEENPSANDPDGGVTDDLKALQSFVRDIASNYDCDSDAHKHNNGGCRVCNARKLLII